MNTLSKLSFIALALSLAACNEKVSPELQSGNAASSSTTTSSGPTVAPNEYYFRVTNSSDTMLNYKLHKTGFDNANTNCAINSNSALSSNAYRNDLDTYDITCFFEAEELSLFYNGFNYSVEASKNTCDYIGYSPFSYYDWPAGSSTQSVLQVTCPDAPAAPNQAQIDAALPAAYAGLGCEAFRNTSINPAGNVAFETDQDLCAFDHTNEGGPNCDPGLISVSGYDVSRVDSDGNGTLDSTRSTPFNRTINCRGKVTACVDGPIRSEATLANYTSGLILTRTTNNAAPSKQYSMPALMGSRDTNRKYVNFRRDLASLEIEYGNSDRSGGDLTASYMSAFGDPLHKYEYNPELINLYANNKRMDGTTLVTATHVTNQAAANGNFAQTPISAEAFLGLGSKVSPFYTFYCFDNALDVRARIRMVVRDWDRVHSSTPTDRSFERISDVDLLPPLARQDVPYTDEVTGEPDSWNAFNDLADWDDLIDMERDDAGVAYDPTVTVWRPMPNATYTEVLTNGFFNPSWYPREN